MMGDTFKLLKGSQKPFEIRNNKEAKGTLVVGYCCWGGTAKGRQRRGVRTRVRREEAAVEKATPM
jgi:hypothetical protein